MTTLPDKPNDAVLRMLPHDADNLTVRLNLTMRASPILATTPEKLAARLLRLWLFVVPVENEFVSRQALMFVVRFWVSTCGQNGLAGNMGSIRRDRPHDDERISHER